MNAVAFVSFQYTTHCFVTKKRPFLRVLQSSKSVLGNLFLTSDISRREMRKNAFTAFIFLIQYFPPDLHGWHHICSDFSASFVLTNFSNYFMLSSNSSKFCSYSSFHSHILPTFSSRRNFAHFRAKFGIFW